MAQRIALPQRTLGKTIACCVIYKHLLWVIMRLRFSLMQWFGIATLWILILAVVGVNEHAHRAVAYRLLNEVEKAQIRHDGFERWLQRHDGQDFSCRHLQVGRTCGTSFQGGTNACKWRKSIVQRRDETKQEIKHLTELVAVRVEKRIQDRVRAAAIVVPIVLMSVLLVPIGLFCRNR